MDYSHVLIQVAALSKCLVTLATFEIFHLFMYLLNVPFQLVWLTEDSITVLAFYISVPLMLTHDVLFQISWKIESLITNITLITLRSTVNCVQVKLE